MSSSNVVPDDAKDEFWAVVQDCLREFHRMKPETLRRKSKKLRDEIEQTTTSQMELFYHSEPFEVACEIAEEPLDVKKYLDRYLHIRDEKHGTGISEQYYEERRKAKARD